MQYVGISHFNILVHLVVTHYLDHQKLREESIDDLNRGVHIAQDIWNIGLSINERHMVDAMRAPSYARRFFEKKVLPYFDLDDCLTYPNNIYKYSMIRNTRLPIEQYGDTIGELYSMTQERFEWECHYLSISEEIKKEIYKKLKNPTWDAIGEEDIVSWVYQILDNNKKDRTIENIQPWMRELQALMNHTPYEGLGYITSRYAFNCYEEFRLTVEQDECDISKLMINTLETHREVAILMTLWHNTEAAYMKSLEKKFGNELYFKKLKDQQDVIHPEIAGILHHMIDWYIRTLPWHMRRRSPQQILTGTILSLSYLYDILAQVDSRDGERNWDIYSLLPHEQLIRYKYLKDKGWSSVRQDLSYFEDEFPVFFSGDLALLLPQEIDTELVEKVQKKLKFEHAV